MYHLTNFIVLCKYILILNLMPRFIHGACMKGSQARMEPSSHCVKPTWFMILHLIRDTLESHCWNVQFVSAYQLIIYHANIQHAEMTQSFLGFCLYAYFSLHYFQLDLPIADKYCGSLKKAPDWFLIISHQYFCVSLLRGLLTCRLL